MSAESSDCLEGTTFSCLLSFPGCTDVSDTADSFVFAAYLLALGAETICRSLVANLPGRAFEFTGWPGLF